MFNDDYAATDEAFAESAHRFRTPAEYDEFEVRATEEFLNELADEARAWWMENAK